MFTFRKKRALKVNTQLTELDELYAKTIVFLPIDVRENYCINLIGRCNLDLKDPISEIEKIRIKNLIHAAKNEIHSLAFSDG